MSFTGMHSVDLLIIVLCLAGMVFGFTQGLLRQVIILGTLYVATVLGVQYYSVVTTWLVGVFRAGMTNRFLNGVAFMLIMLLVTTILNIMAFDVYRTTRLRLFPLLDHFGGSILGLATIVILVTLLLPVASFALTDPMPYNDQWRAAAFDELRLSQLVPLFNTFMPIVLNGLGPWLPRGVPALFAP